MLDLKKVITAIFNGQTILTPNNRLSMFLQEKYAEYQQARNVYVWPSPKIYALNQWLLNYANQINLQQSFKNPNTQPVTIISNDKFFHIVYTIVDQSFKHHKIKPNQRFVEKVAQTYLNLHRWLVHDKFQQANQHFQSAYNEYYETNTSSLDKSLFKTWFNTIKSTLENLHFQTLPEALVQIINQPELQQNHNQTPILVVNSLDLSPLYKKVLENFEVSYELLHPHSPNNSKNNPNTLNSQNINVYKALDKKHEIDNAVHWLSCQTDKFAAVIIPELEEYKSLATEAINKYFEDQDLVNLSAPLTLLQYEMISLILLVIKGFIFGKELKSHELGLLISSPYLIGGIGKRLYVDALTLHITQNFEFLDIDALYDITYKLLDKLPLPSKDAVRGLIDLVNNYLLVKTNFKHLNHQENATKLPISQWLNILKDVLAQLRWPSEMPLTSVEYQLHKSFVTFMEELREYDDIYNSISLTEFLEILQISLNKKRFLPETKHKKLHILGLLEGTGIPFEGLWVCNMHHEFLPSPIDPSPFLETNFQEQFDMPKSNPKRELVIAKELLKQFMVLNSSNLQLSYPLILNDKTMEKSFLLAEFKDKFYDHNRQGSVNKPNKPEPSHIQKPNPLNSKDISLVTINPHDYTFPKPNTNITTLNAFVKCPFIAFSKLCNQDQPTQYDMGFIPLERGVLIHDALQKFWLEVGSKSKLAALSPNVIKLKVHSATKTSINIITANRLQKCLPKIHPKLIEYELKRTTKIIYEWLEFELNRNDFTVTALEKSFNFTLGAQDSSLSRTITLKVKVDRIDTMDNHNKFVVIDYKTGNSKYSNQQLLNQDTIEDWQLPIYSLTQLQQGIENASVVWGLVVDDVPKFIGVSDISLMQNSSSSHIKPIKNFSDLQKQWLRQLTTLTNSFINELGHLRPINGRDTCRDCFFKTSCRLNVGEVS